MANMLWIGPLQIIIAFVGMLVSKDEGSRKHFSFYLAGVFLYFIVLILLFQMAQVHEDAVIHLVFFYLGAFILFIYNWLIVLGGFAENGTQSAAKRDDKDFILP